MVKMSKNINGKKLIRFDGKDYFITKLVHITKDNDINHNYKEGECVDLSTGEVFDIKDIDRVFEEKYKEFNESADIVGYDIVTKKVGEVVTISFLPGYSTSAIESKIRQQKG